MYQKNIAATAMGALVEWAEFTFYGYLVYLFSHLFFSMLSSEWAILAAFGGFAVSYLARPLGSLIFGHIGDKQGRQKALAYSIFLMGIVTLGMGLLPTYQQIGLLAPVLLLILRFLQGISVGGEFTGAAVFILEHTPQKPYLSSSWISASSAAGMLIGGLAAVIVSLPGMPTWAWRIPFGMGGLACLTGFYIRRRLAETAAYQSLQAARAIAPSPIKLLLTRYKKSFLRTMALGIFVAIYIYICNIWWITYVIKAGYFSELTARVLATIAQASVVLLTPLLGLAAEKGNGRTLMQIGLLCSIFVAPLLFFASAHQSFYGVLTVNLGYAAALAAVTATMFKYIADLFPAPVRYTGLAAGWSFGVALFGGSAPLVAQILAAHHLTYLIVAYVACSALLAIHSAKLPQVECEKQLTQDTGSPARLNQKRRRKLPIHQQT